VETSARVVAALVGLFLTSAAMSYSCPRRIWFQTKPCSSPTSRSGASGSSISTFVYRRTSTLVLRPRYTTPISTRTDARQLVTLRVWIAEQMHVYGIGRANVGGAWYARLKRALDEDIARLTADRSKGFLEYSGSRRWFLVGDLGMIALVAAFAVTVIVRAC
jgi:hypothetical protein